MALAKANRLKARSDFQAVFQAGIRHKSSHLTLRALRMKQSMPTQSAKIGISISTKVSKRAVVRNRIKRQIRAAFRSLLPQIAPQWRLVIIVQPQAVADKCDYQQFLQELEQLLTKAEAIDGHS
ncbi:ribonuclease P protein component [Aliterella atlantica]|uniref:Ribonuclease P protein component n=1 Tax=Aliterella atlantica CENA595 TaxID=1618023 RepID=A0A0D8ZV51_9CYAN|nr:ribonuclease P protein component [Aliterella atlantica]KJH72242.1 ribonuclease P [Aliterella atlantica CENA595]